MVQKKGIESAERTGEKQGKMIIKITCPNCNFSKEISGDKVPTGSRWATCPSCGQRFEFAPPQDAFGFDQDQEAGPETETEDKIIYEEAPWEKRSELGLWQAIYRTVKAVLFSPENFFSILSFQGGYKEPLAFGLLLGSIGTMISVFWHFLTIWGGNFSIVESITSRFTINIIFLGIIILAPVFVAINIFLTSGIIHLLLLIVRGGNNGFEATFRVVAYCQAVQILGAFPFIGGLISALWLLVVLLIGIKEIHKISYLRVIIAFLIPLALFILLIIAVVTIFFTLF